MAKRAITIVLIGLGILGGLYFIVWFGFMRSVEKAFERALTSSQKATTVGTARINLGDAVLEVERADTAESRAQGLSGRDAIAPFDGMLFVFDAPGKYGFWMKNMRFPIDIIWFDEDRVVVDIVEEALPEGEQPDRVYEPKAQALYVIEVAAGWMRAHSVSPGDAFFFCESEACARPAEVPEEVAEEAATHAPLNVETASSTDKGVFRDVEENVTATSTPSFVMRDVPFTPQAPFGNWADPREQDGCEEASILMAARWAMGGGTLTGEEALEEILLLSKYQEDTYGFFEDTGASDTAKLMVEYYKSENVSVIEEPSVETIKQALAEGFLVIAPMDGQKVGNPNYTRPGPPRHMIVIIGYDDATGEFITNDPGTRRGKGFRYSYEKFVAAIRDYPSGKKVSSEENRKAMIVVGR